jgi:hypothetical protein
MAIAGGLVGEAAGAAVIVPVKTLSMDSGDGHLVFVLVSVLGALVGFGWPTRLSRAWRFFDRQGDLSERDPNLAPRHAAVLIEDCAVHLQPLVGNRDLGPDLGGAAANAHEALTRLRDAAEAAGAASRAHTENI